MYTSSLNALLRVVQVTQATCTLVTGGAETGEPWRAQLTLSEGQVISCQVQQSADGQLLLTAGSALQWLASQGSRSWDQVGNSPKVLLPASRPPQAEPLLAGAVPHRLAVWGPAERGTWSRKHRQIFGLVDGTRSIERIALMLCQPLDLVQDIVRDLQAQGAITVMPGSLDEVREKESVL
jgi:hypothetical protein